MKNLLLFVFLFSFCLFENVSAQVIKLHSVEVNFGITSLTDNALGVYEMKLSAKDPSAFAPVKEDTFQTDYSNDYLRNRYSTPQFSGDINFDLSNKKKNSLTSRINLGFTYSRPIQSNYFLYQSNYFQGNDTSYTSTLFYNDVYDLISFHAAVLKSSDEQKRFNFETGIGFNYGISLKHQIAQKYSYVMNRITYFPNFVSYEQYRYLYSTGANLKANPVNKFCLFVPLILNFRILKPLDIQFKGNTGLAYSKIKNITGNLSPYYSLALGLRFRFG